MFAEFLNIIFKSIKLDKSLYSDNKNFGEASIYFAGLIMILDGIAGAVAANTIIKTAVAMSGLTAILTWFVWAIFIFVIGVKLFPDKQTKVPFKKVLTAVGFELKGKIIGLIGLGRVGSQVAKIANAFGMQVIAWSENLDLDKCKELNVLPCSKEDLIKTSDYISIHVQGGERYKDCITIKEFDQMKKTAFLINTSRGPIVNEDDLIIALSTNVIAGAGIDVYEKEPLPSDHKLRFLPNALLLPHLGYVTAENYSIFYNQMIENLEACVSGKPIRKIE